MGGSAQTADRFFFSRCWRLPWEEGSHLGGWVAGLDAPKGSSSRIPFSALRVNDWGRLVFEVVVHASRKNGQSRARRGGVRLVTDPTDGCVWGLLRRIATIVDLIATSRVQWVREGGRRGRRGCLHGSVRHGAQRLGRRKRALSVRVVEGRGRTSFDPAPPRRAPVSQRNATAVRVTRCRQGARSRPMGRLTDDFRVSAQAPRSRRRSEADAARATPRGGARQESATARSGTRRGGAPAEKPASAARGNSCDATWDAAATRRKGQGAAREVRSFRSTSPRGDGHGAGRGLPSTTSLRDRRPSRSRLWSATRAPAIVRVRSGAGRGRSRWPVEYVQGFAAQRRAAQ